MAKKKLNLLLESKIAVGIVIAVLFVLGVILVTEGLIDTAPYREAVIRTIKEKTGQEPAIKGKVSLSLLPMPTVYIQNIEWHSAHTDTPSPAVSMDMLRLSVAPLTLFSDHPQITKITLDRPVLSIARAEDGSIHWDWLNSDLITSVVSGWGSLSSLSIVDGKLIYQNASADKNLPIENIYAEVTMGPQATFTSAFVIGGRNLHLNFAKNGNDSSPHVFPFHAKLSADAKNAFQLQGNIDTTAPAPKITGDFTLATDDLFPWLNPSQTEQKALLQEVTGSFGKDQKKTQGFPLTLAGKLAAGSSGIIVTDLKLDGIHSKASGKAAWLWKEKQSPIVSCDLDFSTLDYNQWIAVYNPLEHLKDQPEGESPLPADLKFNLGIRADMLFVGDHPWKNAALSAQLAEGLITVNRFGIELPGESTLMLFGILSQAATGSGLRFEGSLETSGKSLKQALTVLDASALTLPDIGFGVFSVRSNIFISSEQLRLSEADVKLSDLHLNGGMVAYFDTHPHMEADVKLRNINFDYFRDAWREQHKHPGPHDAFLLTVGKEMDFSWLKKLRTTIDLTVNVEGFTFLERQGDSAYFRLAAKEGEFGIYDVRFNYPTDSVDGSFSVNVKGEQPLFNLMLNANELSTDYFLPLPSPAAPTPTPVASDKSAPLWSEDLFDTHWMEGYSGVFDISIARLHHKRFDIDRLKTQLRLENNTLTLKSCNFIYQDGQWRLLGSFYGGEVPGISLSFTLYSIEVHDLLRDFMGHQNISGKMSISGTINTSGVNPLSWVSQADAKLAIAGRGIVVDGLNLQGVLDAVGASRTTADVFNNVNLALVNGTSQLSVDGAINIKNGSAKTPGIALKSGLVTGNLTGEIRLVPWTMELSTLFEFPSLPSDNIPTMTVQLIGPVGRPEMHTDTSSLEAYVARRITGIGR